MKLRQRLILIFGFILIMLRFLFPPVEISLADRVEEEKRTKELMANFDDLIKGMTELSGGEITPPMQDLINAHQELVNKRGRFMATYSSRPFHFLFNTPPRPAKFVWNVVIIHVLIITILAWFGYWILKRSPRSNPR